MQLCLLMESLAVLPSPRSKLPTERAQNRSVAVPPSTNLSVATMGIDIGKNSFHVVGLDQRGAIVARQRWTRSRSEPGWPTCHLA